MKPDISTTPPTDALKDLTRQVESLRDSLLQKTETGETALLDLPPGRHQSAENLLHYLALRSQDLRPLQDHLARLGLSSLGRLESHVLATINAVLHNLYLINGQDYPAAETSAVYTAFDQGTDQLEQSTLRLLGNYPSNRRVHIIVTISREAADDYLMVHQLLESGMSCMRINCAHDDFSVWARMIEHLRNAELATGRSCRVLMDLSGPKLRLGPMEQVPAVRKIRPVRASDGRVLRPARIWLAKAGSALSEMPSADASIMLDPAWLATVAVGDRIRFRDARGSNRCWRVRETTEDGCWAEAKKTAYVENGTVLRLHDRKGGHGGETKICHLPEQDSVCLLRSGDTLFISSARNPGKPAIHDVNGVLLNPGRASLPIPEIYRDIRLGEPIFFDDGRIAGIIEKRESTQFQVRITHTRKPVEKLEGYRGVNLPGTNLSLPALSAKDRKDLEFAVSHADMVGLSFANCVEDVRDLHGCLDELDGQNIGVVLKIETKRGFANLPEILLESMKFPACGVMIARGDLAVECGFERLSEVQEEMLWICEAAHVPVIWATQVLEGLTKYGHASRAEITDAAMSQAAEAVMLNKGAYVTEAVRTLDDILQRMQGHHHKKHSMLRKLHLAAEFQSSRS